MAFDIRQFAQSHSYTRKILLEPNERESDDTQKISSSKLRIEKASEKNTRNIYSSKKIRFLFKLNKIKLKKKSWTQYSSFNLVRFCSICFVRDGKKFAIDEERSTQLSQWGWRVFHLLVKDRAFFRVWLLRRDLRRSFYGSRFCVRYLSKYRITWTFFTTHQFRIRVKNFSKIHLLKCTLYQTIMMITISIICSTVER